MGVKRGLLCTLLCVCMGLAAGCGRQEQKPAPKEPAEVAALWMKGDLSRPPYIQGTQNWACMETWEPVLPEPDFDYEKLERSDYAIWGSDIFVLSSYLVKSDGEQSRQQLYRLDGNTRECKAVTPFWEEGGATLKVSGVEAVADEKLAVWGTQTTGEDSRQCLILWDLSAGTGTVTEVSAGQGSVEGRWCDAQGNVFLVTYEIEAQCHRLRIFGEKNTPGRAEELRAVDSDKRIRLYCRLSDGTPLVRLEDNAVYFDVGTGAQKELVSLNGSGEMDSDGIVDANGVMFSWDSNSGDVHRWDPYSGANDKLLNLRDYGINVGRQGSLLMGVDQAGQLLVLWQNSGKPAVSVLGPVKEGELSEGTLSLTNIWYHDSNVKTAAVQYSSLHPECTVSYFTGFEEDSAAFYDRTMMEVASGKGSDILFVHGSDMEKLYEKGALADLTGILDDETCRQLFPAVLESGTRDGKLIGLPVTVDVYTYMTVQDIWQKDSWTYEEAISLWQQYKDEGAICFQVDRHTKESLLENFLLKNIADSPFLDLENGSCDFDNKLFRQALELIGGCRCSYESSYLGPYEQLLEYAAQVKAGKYLVQEVEGAGVVSRSNAWEIYGDENCYPGYPSDSGKGNVFHCYGYLVVNAGTEHFEEAADFLRYYYGKEFQTAQGSGLRRDVLREQYEVKDGEIINKADGAKVPDKPDGGSFIDDAIAFLDSCGPEPAEIDVLREIIEEEAAAYFQGSQNLDNTVKNIQNRVQLYLNENN